MISTVAKVPASSAAEVHVIAESLNCVIMVGSELSSEAQVLNPPNHTRGVNHSYVEVLRADQIALQSMLTNFFGDDKAGCYGKLTSSK